MSPDELREHVRAEVDKAPPLSVRQLERLRLIVRPAVAAIRAARGKGGARDGT